MDKVAVRIEGMLAGVKIEEGMYTDRFLVVVI
jgi:hypothetical protein